MVEIGDIAVELGRPAPEPNSIESEQWTRWIAQALLLIRTRFGTLDGIDTDVLDYVVTQAVVAHVRRPDDSTQVSTSVDDASVSRTYQSSAGRVVILPEWWALLSDARGTGSGAGAFAIDTAGAGVRGGEGHARICNIFFGGSDCSCGAYLTMGRYPLYETDELS